MEKDYIYGRPILASGMKKPIKGFGTSEYYVKEIPRKTANDLIIKHHYSGKIYNATYIHLGVYGGGELLGVLQYGYAMNPASAGSVVANTEKDEYLELNRMWLDDCLPRNSESMAISYSIKYIKKKYPKIKWIQSFADERCGGFGIVYQACNFDYYGEHKSTFWTLDDVTYHNSLMTRSPELSKSARYLQENKDRATSESLRQFRYIYFIKRNVQKDCLHKKLPYLKHYNGD